MPTQGFHRFDSKEAAEAGRRGVEAKRQKAQLAVEDPAAFAEKQLGRHRRDYLKFLDDAVRGQGRYENISTHDSLTALYRALDYAIGKPRLAEKTDKPTAEAEDSGLVLVSVNADEASGSDGDGS